MPKAFFLVRAIVSEPQRDRFDQWYATDRLPRAHVDLKSEKCFRLWSTVEPGVHYAIYQFADMAACDAALKSQAFKDLVADFDHNFPQGVTRTRDVMTLLQEVGA